MTMSPQSQAVIDRLLQDERVASGQVAMGPLNADCIRLLRVLIDNGTVLQGESGAAQAAKLRELYSDAKTQEEDREGAAAGGTISDPGEPNSASRSGDAAPSGPPESPVADVRPARWRLHHLTCQSIRGVDPSGEALSFPFNGLPTLIFGPNGSGKSSLLGAAVWVLTGRIITDAGDDSEDAALYTLPRSGADRGSKLRNWPVVVTLPQAASPASAAPECSANLELHSIDGTVLHVRRSSSADLETSSDGVSWTTCRSLADHGIAPLDLQLSLLAPTVFGRLTIEQAEDTRSLLSLMLGYDDLETLGDFVSKLGGNRTRLETQEKTNLEAKWGDLRQKLEALPQMLPSKSDLRERLSAIAVVEKPTRKAITEVGKAVNEQIKTAETSLAELLGIKEEGQAPPDGIADKLTAAIAALEKGVWENFPSLAAIRLEVAMPGEEGIDARERIPEVCEKTNTLLASFKIRIVQRLEWWRKEVEPGSRVGLWLRAAQDYAPESAQCPVCNQSIEGLPVEHELAALKSMDPELQQELRTFFRNLLDELKAIVPDSLMALATMSPPDRLLQDWKNLCEETIGAVLQSVTAHFSEPVRTLAAETPAVPDVPFDLFPEDAESNFVLHAAEFIDDVKKAQAALAMLGWADTHLGALRESLDAAVTHQDGDDGASLLATLSRGKQAAADEEPLARVRDELRVIYKSREAIEVSENAVSLLEELATSLEQLKPLAKYAASEVSKVFGTIRDKTIANWRLLYPEMSSGLDPARLVLGKGRDKTVEALLGCGTYEVQGKHFANAGLQRAIALSFFFALLDEHPGGLGFVVMDDPILSLDEDHRESWSANLLRPAMESTQIILATHQRQYLNNCRYDFREGSVVELNPRSRSRPMSWRPGFRLDRAAEELQRAPTNAPNELRKYREELLCTLDAYSPSPFFDPADLSNSLQAYRSLTAPHPLAGRGQARIVECLDDAEVTRVLDPGSHHLTEADVTAPMSTQCLTRLRDCDARLRRELDRLERLRSHERQGRSLPEVGQATLGISGNSVWDQPIRIHALGRAAAKGDSWVCDASENAAGLVLPSGAAAIALTGTLEPVIRVGQWILIAADDVVVRDGDLVVARSGERRLLRRAWTDGPNWQLMSINPTREISPVLLPRADTMIRRIWGVLYEPLRLGYTERPGDDQEWQPRADFDRTWLTALHIIAVEGDSLEPLARRGQSVLVAGRQVPAETTLEQGGLAVLETTDESIGNVVKRAFRRDDQWILVSPNPVDPHEPLVIQATAIAAAWPLRGVVFETSLESSDDE